MANETPTVSFSFCLVWSTSVTDDHLLGRKEKHDRYALIISRLAHRVNLAGTSYMFHAAKIQLFTTFHNFPCNVKRY